MNAIVGVFEGRAIRAFLINGRPAVLAFELGRALGYSDPKRLVGKIRESWYREIHGGEHFDVVSGENLREINAVTREVPGAGTSGGPLTPARPNRAMVLYEPGVNLVLLKSEAPLADKIRAWLANEVMPQLARTGSYTPKAPEPPPPPALPPPPREVRMVPRPPAQPAPLPEQHGRLKTVSVVLADSTIELARAAARHAGLDFDEFVEVTLLQSYYSLRAHGHLGSMR